MYLPKTVLVIIPDQKVTTGVVVNDGCEPFLVDWSGGRCTCRYSDAQVSIESEIRRF